MDRKFRPAGPGRLARAGVALGCGSLGGLAFNAAHLPLPWMLGALIFTMVAALSGLGPHLPMAVRPPVVAVIGVLLGAGFHPDMLAQVGQWAISLAVLMVYMAGTALVVVPWYRHVGGYDLATAWFAGMPGGLGEMTVIGASMGGDERRIILAHTARIILSIALLAFWFRIVQGVAVGRTAQVAGLFALPWRDGLILLAAGALGAGLGVRLRWPAPSLLGPLVLSGGLHLAQVTALAPPPGLVIAAQVILGTTLGCRFVGVPLRAVWQAVRLSMGATLATLALALGCAGTLAPVLGLRLDQILLAYSPGGLTEMSLIALAMHADVAFVALHHVARITTVIALAPLLARIMGVQGKRRP